MGAGVGVFGVGRVVYLISALTFIPSLFVGGGGRWVWSVCAGSFHPTCYATKNGFGYGAI